MVCQQVRPIMHKYLDGDLSFKESQDLKNHLLSCGNCHQYFKQLETTEAIVRSMVQVNVEPSDELTMRIANSIPVKKQNNRYLRWLKKHPGLSVAIIFSIIMLTSVVAMWEDQNQLMVQVADLDQVVIEGDTVYVPEGQTIRGDLIVRSGRVLVDGEVQGDLVVIDGTFNMASTARVTGEIIPINQMYSWVWYKVNDFFRSFSK